MITAEPGRIAKTMSFLVGEEAILVLIEGMSRVDNKKFKDTFHVKAKMIPYDQVEEWMAGWMFVKNRNQRPKVRNS